MAHLSSPTIALQRYDTLEASDVHDFHQIVLGIDGAMVMAVDGVSQRLDRHGAWLVPAGARHEAGDLIVAQVDWQHVASLADVLAGTFDRSGPLLFKSVGCAAWDLAACRTARDALAERQAG